MRREWRWLIAVVLALAVGATCAEPYARLAGPYYDLVVRAVARWHPWSVEEVAVVDDPRSHGAVLRITAWVYRHPDDPRPAAKVVGRVQVGEVVETPIVFWTFLLVWRARSFRAHLIGLAIGVPIFLVLEAATTGMQLVHSMAQASAALAGDDSPTAWDLWSRFLEAGGGFVLALAAALGAIGIQRPKTVILADYPAGGSRR